jgi:hypothetical protein
MDSFDKEQLLFHELGHCVLNRKHCDLVVNLDPISLMHPKMLKSEYYKNNRDELIEELFNADPRCK